MRFAILRGQARAWMHATSRPGFVQCNQYYDSPRIAQQLTPGTYPSAPNTDTNLCTCGPRYTTTLPCGLLSSAPQAPGPPAAPPRTNARRSRTKTVGHCSTGMNQLYPTRTRVRASQLCTVTRCHLLPKCLRWLHWQAAPMPYYACHVCSTAHACSSAQFRTLPFLTPTTAAPGWHRKTP